MAVGFDIDNCWALDDFKSTRQSNSSSRGSEIFPRDATSRHKVMRENMIFVTIFAKGFDVTYEGSPLAISSRLPGDFRKACLMTS